MRFAVTSSSRMGGVKDFGSRSAYTTLMVRSTSVSKTWKKLTSLGVLKQCKTHREKAGCDLDSLGIFCVTRVTDIKSRWSRKQLRRR